MCKLWTIYCLKILTFFSRSTLHRLALNNPFADLFFMIYEIAVKFTHYYINLPITLLFKWVNWLKPSAENHIHDKISQSLRKCSNGTFLSIESLAKTDPPPKKYLVNSNKTYLLIVKDLGILIWSHSDTFAGTYARSASFYLKAVSRAIHRYL